MINKCKTEGLIYHNYPNTFIKYSNDIRCIFKNIDDYDHTKKHKTLIVFGDMIGDMLSDKKIEPIVMEPFISDKKTEHFSCIYCSIIICSFKKNIRFNYKHYCTMRIPDMEGFSFSHLSDI